MHGCMGLPSLVWTLPCRNALVAAVALLVLGNLTLAQACGAHLRLLGLAVT